MRRVPLIVGLCAAACSLNNPGEEPPRAKIYFPTAVAIADNHLLVASSNFDIRYSAGSLQAYDLDVLNEQVDACLADPSAEGCECQPNPRDSSGPKIPPCVLPNTQDLLGENAEVLIGSFASGLAYSAVRGRVYVPTRNNAGGLAYVNFVAGALSCGEQGGRRCSSSFLAGTDGGTRNITIPTQPSTVAVGDAAQLGLVDEADVPLTGQQYVLVGDQSGALSLFFDAVGAEEGKPELQFVRRGLAGQVTDIAVGDRSAYVALDLGSNSSGEKLISQIAFPQAPPEGFYAIYVAAQLRIGDLGTQPKIRSLAFMPGSTSDLLAVTLSPSALVRVDLARPRQQPFELRAESVIALGSGPSKVQVATVGTDARPFAFVSCFDSHEILVIDVELRRMVSAIQGLAGPFSLAVDSARSRLYVGDFMSSTVRIVDLLPLVEANPDPTAGPAAPHVIGTLGRPSDPQVLK